MDEYVELTDRLRCRSNVMAIQELWSSERYSRRRHVFLQVRNRNRARDGDDIRCPPQEPSERALRAR